MGAKYRMGPELEIWYKTLTIMITIIDNKITVKGFVSEIIVFFKENSKRQLLLFCVAGCCDLFFNIQDNKNTVNHVYLLINFCII